MPSPNNMIFWATVRFLEERAESTREMAMEGAIGVLCGMQIAFQHPEYAQAYIQLMAQTEGGLFSSDDIDQMVRAIPIEIATEGE